MIRFYLIGILLLLFSGSGYTKNRQIFSKPSWVVGEIHPLGSKYSCEDIEATMATVITQYKEWESIRTKLESLSEQINDFSFDPSSIESSLEELSTLVAAISNEPAITSLERYQAHEEKITYYWRLPPPNDQAFNPIYIIIGKEIFELLESMPPDILGFSWPPLFNDGTYFVLERWVSPLEACMGRDQMAIVGTISSPSLTHLVVLTLESGFKFEEHQRPSTFSPRISRDNINHWQKIERMTPKF